jgi:hypothetical protein
MSLDSKIALAMSASGASFEDVHNNLLKEAKDFAVKFLEWTAKSENRLGYHEINKEWYHWHSDKWLTTEELLEMYETEKKL